MKIAYGKQKRLAGKTKKLIESINGIVEEYSAQGRNFLLFPSTVINLITLHTCNTFHFDTPSTKGKKPFFDSLKGYPFSGHPSLMTPKNGQALSVR